MSPQRSGSAGEIFLVFLKLGLTSFGGPIAHLGYFRQELVVRRRWIEESAYGDLVALCQFLPGPASSQIGFSLGLIRGGWQGGVAAWAGFTLPSAIALLFFAAIAPSLSGPIGIGVQHGLKLVAVAIVAQAVWGMARSLCPDRPRAAIALAALALVVFAHGAAGQIAAIALGGLAGFWLCRASLESAVGMLPPIPVARTTAIALLATFAVLLAAAMAVGNAAEPGAVGILAAFYRSGALVFGGGHVVLPLLRDAVVTPGWVSDDAFLAGYGAAQAVPGPLFSFAAYLGAVLRTPPAGITGAALALVAIFLPGLLLVAGALPFWDVLRRRGMAQAAMRGSNAAVVGVLGAALYDPVWTSAVITPVDFVTAAVGFILLTVWRAPPLAVVGIVMAAATLARLLAV
jgi:chromate transporter